MQSSAGNGGQWIVSLDARAPASRVESSVRDLGGRVLERFAWIDALLIQLDPSKHRELAAQPGVREIYRNRVLEPCAIRDSTNKANHNADAVHASLRRGAGVTIAVMDTGLDAHTGKLRRAHRTFYTGGDPTKGRLRLKANIQIGRLPADNSLSHGTAVASVAAGERWGTLLSDPGHAPLADLVGYSVANSLTGATDSATAIRAIARVAADTSKFGIRVLLFAYNGSPDPADPVQQALDRLALQRDILVVVPAGNGAALTTSSQAGVNGLAVGASLARGQKRVWPMSSRGPIRIGGAVRNYPDLIANGVGTVTAWADNEGRDLVSSGTSLAAAQVAGAALLYRAWQPRASALETKAMLLATLEDVSIQNERPPYDTRNAYGLGYLRDDELMKARKSPELRLVGKIGPSAPRASYALPVSLGRSYSIVVTWPRTNLGLRHWTNVSLELRRGNDVLARSDSPANAYERIVYRATRSEKLQIVVSGRSWTESSLPFGLAALEIPLPHTRGRVELIGKSCSGSRSGQRVAAFLPASMGRYFGNSSTLTPLNGAVQRSQFVYDASALAKNSVADGLAWRHDNLLIAGPVRGHWIDIELRLGESKVAAAKPSPQFAANIGAAKVVLKRRKLLLPDLVTRPTLPGQWAVRIPFDAPWRRSYATPSLVVEARVFAADDERLYYLDAIYDRQTPLASSIVATSPKAISGRIIPGYAPALALTRTSSSTKLAPRLFAGGEPRIGRTFDLHLQDGPPSSFAVVWLGLSTRHWGIFGLPLSMTPFGARGCSIYSDVVLPVPIALDAAGHRAVKLTLPNTRLFVLYHFYYQAMCFDPRANLLGASFSNALGTRIGG